MINQLKKKVQFSCLLESFNPRFNAYSDVRRQFAFSQTTAKTFTALEDKYNICCLLDVQAEGCLTFYVLARQWTNDLARVG